MRVLVMGGGIVGVTTAYQLLQDGHEVVLLERREGIALETSWGKAGMIAPGHSFAWSSPQAPMILQVAVRQEPGSALSAVGRSPALELVLALPAPMHGGTGADQYTAQAPPVHVLAEDPA
jgi:glycine/D-amino acid oxidase-like deaminating enzyme